MSPTDQKKDSGSVQERPAPRASSHLGYGYLLVILAAVLLLGTAIYRGMRSRAVAAAGLVRTMSQDAIPVVNILHPKPGAPLAEITLPGNAQAFSDAPIYARTNGYLSRWYFDIGARVNEGDLLAEIATPEVDRQLDQARADLETAKANLSLAQITADRWIGLLASDSVSKQETDQAIGNLQAQKATVDSNSANVRRLQQLQSFEKVSAPFAGVITARNTDVGALINASGSTVASKELFHVAAIHRLRVYVAVPEVYSRAAANGATVTLTLDEFAGRVFHGTLVRNSNSIDPASRTLLVEVDVDNAGGLLLPGAYMLVHLKLPEQARSVTIPVNTLLFRSDGLTVAVVKDGHVALTTIKIGRDYGDRVEVLSGLKPTDAIIRDPSDSLLNGAEVHVKVSQ